MQLNSETATEAGATPAAYKDYGASFGHTSRLKRLFQRDENGAMSPAVWTRSDCLGRAFARLTASAPDKFLLPPPRPCCPLGCFAAVSASSTMAADLDCGNLALEAASFFSG